MKKIILTLLLLLLPAFSFASFDISQWQYYKAIEQPTAGLVKFALDDEILSQAKVGLADLRIINNDNQEVPYKILTGESKSKTEIFYPQMLNNSFVAGRNSLVILDLQKKGIFVNQLKIHTPSENFQRNVIIYGSDDRENWQILTDDTYIYDYTDKKGGIKTQNTTLDFPQSVYRYLKLEISDPEHEPVKISKVEAVNYIKEAVREIERYPEFFVTKKEDEKLSEVSIDLGAKGIPTSRILLKVVDQNFNRGVLVYSSADQNNWRFIDSGYIFRYNTPKFAGENLQIHFPETHDRYIKIVIQNKDNQALNVLDLIFFSIYREVIFQAENNKNYKVYYGNRQTRFPEYDLDNFFQYLNIESAKSVSLFGQQDNTFYVIPKEPLTERAPHLLSFALIFTVLILLFLVYKFFKKNNANIT